MPHKASMWKELFGAFTQEEVKQMLDFLNISCSTGYGVLLQLPKSPTARSFSLRFCFQTYLARCTLKIHNAKDSREWRMAAWRSRFAQASATNWKILKQSPGTPIGQID